MEWPDISKLKEINIKQLGNFECESILLYYDLPLLFSTNKSKYLMYFIEVIDGQLFRYLFSNITKELLNDIEEDKIIIRDIIVENLVGIVDIDCFNRPIKAYKILEEDLLLIPGDWLPNPGVKLKT